MTSLPKDNNIIHAINLLSSLSDDQIRQYKEPLRNLTKRIAAITNSNTPNAETILDTAEADLELVRIFLLKDQTGVIFRSAHEPGKDPRTAVLSLRSGDGGFEVALLRLLACRYLASRRREYFPKDIVKGGVQPKSKRKGKGRSLLRAMGLPITNQAEDGLKRGEKMLQIEAETGIPGISLALLPCLAKFDHVYADEASGWSQLLFFYQALYDCHVDSLYSAKEKRRRISSGEKDRI